MNHTGVEYNVVEFLSGYVGPFANLLQGASSKDKCQEADVDWPHLVRAGVAD